MNTIKIITIAICLLSLSSYSADDTMLNGMADKASHGFVNLGYGWIEIPMQIGKGYDRSVYFIEGSPAASRTLGLFWGAGRGFYFAFGRMYLGIYQLFGFWSANPDDNYGIGIPFDGEYPLDAGLLHDIPFGSLHQPMLAKFKRGVGHWANALKSIPRHIPILNKIDFEIPIHIPFTLKYYDIPVRMPYAKSEQLEEPNLSRTAWFISSRMVVGFYETTGCFLPSAIETEGYSFDP